MSTTESETHQAAAPSRRPRRRRRRLVRALAGVLGVTLALAIVWAAASWRYGALDARKARMTTPGPYRADLASLGAHPVPDWFADAKLGVFVHWGLFSVPGFAATKPYADVLRDDYDRAMVRSPYAEDYANAMRDPSSPTAEYHRRTYGDMPYEGFQQIFEREVAGFDADEWAATFQRAGADHVVMVAKYHDGYSLWPTQVRNPHAPDWHSDRDLVGEVASAVRARGMRFGVYYSGGVDWTFQRKLVETLGDDSYLPYGDGYDDYAEAQVRELVQRYRPDVLWNDISWPTGQQRLNAVFADYYNTVPDGVVNDRWQTDSLFRRLMGLPPARGAFDLFFKQVIARDPGVVDRVTPPAVPHADFTTPEYTQYGTTQDFAWETTRGMGTSYGYNRQETDADYASFEQTLFPDFVSAVSRNGRLLLNVGPAGGRGRIPPEQRRRLEAFGGWLDANGQAVRGTRPHQVAGATTADGLPVWFTRAPGQVNAVLVGRPTGPTVRIQGVELPAARGRLLGDGSLVTVTPTGGSTVLTFDHDLDGAFAPAVAVPTGQASR
jgi:alpha-L-fucosidase